MKQKSNSSKIKMLPNLEMSSVVGGAAVIGAGAGAGARDSAGVLQMLAPFAFTVLQCCEVSMMEERLTS